MNFRPLSRIEAKILSRLQSDGRATKRALARDVGLAPSTTLDRVRDLEDRGVITGYHAEVSLQALGRSLEAFVAIRINPKTQSVVDGLINRLLELPETMSVFVVSGDDDILAHLAVADTQALQQVILDNISTVEGVIDEKTSLIFQSERNHVIAPVDAEPSV